MLDVLPVELIGAISTFVRPIDLPSFALVDKTCNIYATPHLYHTIILSHLKFVRALSCTRTLASPPETHAFGRDLAALVHRFEVGYAETHANDCGKIDPIGNRLRTLSASSAHQMLVSMINLCSLEVSYKYDILGTLHPLLMLHAVVNTRHEALSSIVIDGTSYQSLSDEDLFEVPTITKLRKLTPSLRCIRLSLPRKSSALEIRLLKAVLSSISENARTIGLYQKGWGEPDNAHEYLDKDITFPSLHKFALCQKGFHLPHTKRFEHARSLELLASGGWADADQWAIEGDGGGESDSSSDEEDDEGSQSAGHDEENHDSGAVNGNDVGTASGFGDETPGSDGEDDEFLRPVRILRVLRGTWPNLEEISCTTSNLASFLPRRAPPSKRRPISSVRIGNADYDPFHDGVLYHASGAPPRWPRLLKFLSHLHYSAVPIRELKFTVKDLDVPSLARLVVQHPHLETLVIVTDIGKPPTEADLFSLGAQVFARAPALQTFLLSDDIFRFFVRAPYEFARDIPLQRSLLADYDKHAPGLRRVAFTLECEWEKGIDGWWYHIEGEDPAVWRRRVALDDAHAHRGYCKHDGTPVRHPVDYEGPQDRSPGCQKCYSDTFDHDSE